MSQAEYEYEMERLEFIHKAQQYVWNLWINRFFMRGMLVDDAIARTNAIVKDWTGYPCGITFPVESSEDIPF